MRRRIPEWFKLIPPMFLVLTIIGLGIIIWMVRYDR